MISKISSIASGVTPKMAMYGAVAIGALGIVVYFWVKTYSLSLDLARCETANSELAASVQVKRMEIETLTESVTRQNEAIREVERVSEVHKQEAATAQIEAIDKTAVKIKKIVKLAETVGESCEDGIALLNKEFGL